MDSKENELYLEEQRQILLDLKKLMSAIDESLKLGIDVNVENPTPAVDEITIKNSLTIDNIDLISGWLTDLGERLETVIKENSYKPATKVEVTNLTKQPDTLKISNLSEIKKEITALGNLIKDNQPIVNVTKQEIKFPTSAKDAIPVRLSDGKSFYKAMFNAITAASKAVEDPLAGYQVTDQDDSSSTKYYGFANKDGYWYIMRESSGAYRYAKGAPQEGGGGLYSDAWTNRANLTYDYIYEVF